MPRWTPTPVPVVVDEERQSLLLVVDDGGVGNALAAALAARGHRVVTVRHGRSFEALGAGAYAIDLASRSDYSRLMDALRSEDAQPHTVVHLLGVDARADKGVAGRVDDFMSLVYTAQAVVERDAATAARICVVSQGMHDVSGAEPVDPGLSLLLSLCRVAHQEHEHLQCRAIDVALAADGSERTAVASLLAHEVLSASNDPVIAYRGRARRALEYANAGTTVPHRVTPRASTLRDRGVYLIVGGLGGVGFVIAQHLARSVSARLVLVGRSALDTGPEGHAQRDGRLEALAELGADVLVLGGDVCDAARMAKVRRDAIARFGTIHGVVHAATALSGGLIQLIDPKQVDDAIAAKVTGAQGIDRVFAGDELDFLMLCSSLGAICGGAGSLAYCAANAYLDAFAHERSRVRPVVSVNWDRWEDIGIAVSGRRAFRELTGGDPPQGLTPEEAVAAFDRVLELRGLPQVVVTRTDLAGHLALARACHVLGARAAGAEVVPHDRPELSSTFEPAEDDLQRRLATLWQDLFGIRRIGIDDDFFELGGNSLLATQATSRIGRELSVPITVRTVFEQPTVRQLSRALAADRSALAQQIAPPLVGRATTRAPILSFGQVRLWFMDHLTRGQQNYNVSLAVRIDGPLDVPALSRAFATIVDRHETLRSRFVTEDGEPRLLLMPAEAFEIPVIDLSSLDEAAQRLETARLSAEELRRPFDLSRDRLIRVTLQRLTYREHVLLLAMHHIVSDGWSLGVVMRELEACYGAFSSGRPSPLPPLRVQYSDFAAWQRERLAGDVIQRQMAYWRTQLSDVPDLLPLPYDHPRPPTQSFRGGIRICTIGPGLTTALEKRGRESGATLYMTLLAAFNVLLHRYSGQDDILVGSPAANRVPKEVEALVGLFVNTLVLRSDLTGDPSFVELLQRTRRMCLESYTNQDVPFEKLVEEFSPERHADRHPLVQVLFALQDRTFQELSLPGLSVTSADVQIDEARLDLELHVAQTTAGLRCAFNYAADLFDSDTIDRLMRHFVALLERIVENPERPLSRLPLVEGSEGDERAALEAAGAWAEAAPPPVLLPALIEAQVARTPDAVAVRTGETGVTYAALNARANQLAHTLLARGLGPGTLVALAFDRGVDLVVAWLAALKAGTAYLPLDPTAPPARRAALLADAAPALVLTATAPAVPDAVPGLTLADAALATAPAHNPTDGDRPVPLTAAHAAYLLYTSGSTGMPKAVVVTHAGLPGLVAGHRDRLGLTPAARVAQLAAFSFDVATAELAMTFATGATLVLVADAARSGAALRAALVQQRVTHLMLTPSVLATVEDGPDLALATLVVGGEVCPPALRARWTARRVCNAYGPTEATICATLSAPLPPGGDPPSARRCRVSACICSTLPSPPCRSASPASSTSPVPVSPAATGAGPRSPPPPLSPTPTVRGPAPACIAPATARGAARTVSSSSSAAPTTSSSSAASASSPVKSRPRSAPCPPSPTPSSSPNPPTPARSRWWHTWCSPTGRPTHRRQRNRCAANSRSCCRPT